MNSTGSDLLDKFCLECSLEKCPNNCLTLQMKLQSIGQGANDPLDSFIDLKIN